MKTLPIKCALCALFVVNLFFASSVSAAQTDLVGPTGSGTFGIRVLVLSNGNIVVADPTYDITTPTVIADVGAVHLYNGTTGALISTLTGSTANDRVGSGSITALSNDNYVIRSFSWNGNRGAVTFGNGTTGVSGEVSNTNSLVGTLADDSVGDGITILTNGSYVINSPRWNGNRGAVTFGNGTSGVSGAVSNINSLVGTFANDRVGGNGITILTNGNYVVSSLNWNDFRGAVTFASGTTGVSGAVSNANSLVGTLADDYVGNNGSITILTNGNYVVRIPRWNNGRGAVTFGSGTIGISGEISNVNSLVGTLAGDAVGSSTTALTNGNYVVRSPSWNDFRGAATFGSGTTGVSGEISNSNSLVGSTANDLVGNNGITALSNGNYVVSNPNWDNPSPAVTNAGAVTFKSSNHTPEKIGNVAGGD